VLDEGQQALAARSDYNFDHPDAFDFELLISVLRKLKKGKSVKVPVYDFTTHSRRREWVGAAGEPGGQAGRCGESPREGGDACGDRVGDVGAVGPGRAKGGRGWEPSGTGGVVGGVGQGGSTETQRWVWKQGPVQNSGGGVKECGGAGGQRFGVLEQGSGSRQGWGIECRGERKGP